MNRNDAISTSSIKNIGIFAHVDAGKTTLTEQLLYRTGAIRHLGRVDHGNTQTDALELERERGISIISMPTSYTFQGQKVNIIDTPGHVDFVAEVERSMLVLDGAILVISAREGGPVTYAAALQRVDAHGCTDAPLHQQDRSHGCRYRGRSVRDSQAVDSGDLRAAGG